MNQVSLFITFLIASAVLATATTNTSETPNNSPPNGEDKMIRFDATGTGIFRLACLGRHTSCAEWRQHIVKSAVDATISSRAQYDLVLQSISHIPGSNVTAYIFPWWQSAASDEYAWRMFRAPVENLEFACPPLCATWVGGMDRGTSVQVHDATHLGGSGASGCRTDTQPWICSGTQDRWVYQGLNGTSCIDGCNEADVVCAEGIHTSLNCDDLVVVSEDNSVEIPLTARIVSSVVTLAVVAGCVWGCYRCKQLEIEEKKRATYWRYESWEENGRTVHGKVHYYRQTDEEAFRTS